MPEEPNTSVSVNVPSTALNVAPPVDQRRDFILFACRTFNVITALCLLLCAAAFGMAIVLRGNAPTKDVNFISGQAVRIFGIAWSLLLVLVESEMKVVRKYVPLLDVWVARGVVHLFMAALTFREAYPADEATDFQKSLQLYRFVASGALAVCGTIYIAGGVLCLGAIRRARERREERYVQAQVEYDRLERRRRELQHLLGREL